MGSLIGVLFHAIGGFAAGSFYLPIKKIRVWSWESGWLVNGFFAWLIVPLLVSIIAIPNSFQILTGTSIEVLGWTYFFGFLWGIGGLTFGMSMRYLGISLGMAVALGLTAAFGTLIPPLYSGEFFDLLETMAGKIVLAGVMVSLIGIAICGRAGILKDRELSEEKKKEGVKEFNLRKGILVAVISGILSACFAFGLAAGAPIANLAVQSGAPTLWQNSPVFIVILLGGLTSNFIWCVYLNFKNSSYKDYSDSSTPLKTNYLFAALAGTTWYCQFMFYGMGTTYLEDFEFAGWTLHMSFIIIFSTFWGLVTKEWQGVSKKTVFNLALGLFILIASTILIGMGNKLA